MCGLVGLVAPRLAPAERAEIVRRMAARLSHRGPDGEGHITAGPCSLGFRRLAIMDVGAPSPPFFNETKTVWTVANAEIYNSEEIRAGLESRGHTLASGVDTEVIAHLYEEKGAELVHDLNGMFAFAVWDVERRTLLLARDRAGEKPLFYWQGDGELAFASELSALLAHPRVQPVVDAVALRRYLLHDFFPAPKTPFVGIHKLPAGHLLVASGEEVAVRRYWDLADHVDDTALARRSLGDLAEELDHRIGLAVERRRRSDVPLGVYLSGGIDSSTVLAHMAEQVGPGVPVFTLGHTDLEFDESRFARRTGQFFGAEVHELLVGDEELTEGLRRVGKGFDEPLGDASTIPSHLLAVFARQKVKVVLSGEGADELFAGYPTYLGHRYANLYSRVPGPLRRGLLAASRLWPARMGNVGPDYLLARFSAAADRPLVERHHLWFGSLGPDRIDQVLAGRVSEQLVGDDPFASARACLADRTFPNDLSRLLYTDFSMYLQDDLLTKLDRATMLASLEARAPFLDHELAQFAASLPSRCKVSGLTTKAILRRAVKARLPAEVLRRRKRGFNIPFSRWLLRGLGSEFRQRFTPERIEARGLLDPGGVTAILDEHLGRHADHRKPLFNLLALDLWCDKIFGEGVKIPIATEAEAPVPARELVV